MPRKQNQVPAPIEVAVNAEAIAEGQEARNQLAVLHEQDAANVKVLATQLGYTGRLDSDSLESVCKAKLVAAQQSIFEFGASLLLLRESCLHGDWEERLDRIGVSRPTAHRYITIAAKLKGTDVQKALQHLGMGKVLELAAFDDDEIQATLANGSIEIRNEKKPIPQVLNPGEQAVYNKITDNTKVSDINLYMVTSWKEGKMVFRRTEMAEIAQRLSRHFNVNIILQSKKIFNYKYSATFTTETFEEILQLLEKTAPIKCTMIEPKQASDYSYTRRTVIIEAR